MTVSLRFGAGLGVHLESAGRLVLLGFHEPTGLRSGCRGSRLDKVVGVHWSPSSGSQRLRGRCAQSRFWIALKFDPIIVNMPKGTEVLAGSFD